MFNTLPPSRSQNRLLARLAESDFRSIKPHLQPVRLVRDQVLYDFRGPIDYAYFPAGGVLSALNVMEDGNAIEVATVGNEGLGGHSVGLGIMISPNKVIAQITGSADRVEARVLRELASRSNTFRSLLTEYHSLYMTQVSQSVACNGLHRVEQRCCRWLLMSRDRVGSDDIQLTHHFLAVMLGTRRASISDVIRPLQDAGLIHSHRGMLRILDGPGLEALTCECYRVVKDEYDRFYNRPT